MRRLDKLTLYFLDELFYLFYYFLFDRIDYLAKVSLYFLVGFFFPENI